jgi:predicted Na+-dependent transporter
MMLKYSCQSGRLLIIFFLVISILIPGTGFANDGSDEALYRKLSGIARGNGDSALFDKLNKEARTLNWDRADEAKFVGNLRIIKNTREETAGRAARIYLLRQLSGELYILSLSSDPSVLAEGADIVYADLDSISGNKMVFNTMTMYAKIDGETYRFAKLISSPEQTKLDRIFKISIILMLFFVMVGMGMTLTFKEFTLVFKKPRGIILGEILQFGFMPFLAMCLGHLLGFYEHYPFIFVGMILITATPGGVTSNLMTYYAKGDLALSISLTSISTVISLVFTPLLLALYCADMPEINIPLKIVAQTILILVIIPLIVGMAIRGKWQSLAQKATPFFSALGIVSLIVLIIVGVLSNLHAFADTARYGFKFYMTIFSLTMLGMIFGILIPKMFRIDNYQTRAISLETGLRNSSLAMTIALLLQDAMGDFYSSMFVTSGLFGLAMYFAGLIAILSYKPLLPVAKNTGNSGSGSD